MLAELGLEEVDLVPTMYDASSHLLQESSFHFHGEPSSNLVGEPRVDSQAVDIESTF